MGRGPPGPNNKLRKKIISTFLSPPPGPLRRIFFPFSSLSPPAARLLSATISSISSYHLVHSPADPRQSFKMADNEVSTARVFLSPQLSICTRARGGRPSFGGGLVVVLSGEKHHPALRDEQPRDTHPPALCRPPRLSLRSLDGSAELVASDIPALNIYIFHAMIIC